MRIFAIVTACALAACAQDVVWKKPGASDEELARDSDGCRSQAYGAQGMTSDAQRLMAVYQSCMEGKGWHREQAPKS